MISIEAASKVYPAHGKTPPTLALYNVSLKIQEREFVVAVGPSGCGKTSLLNLIAGFERPTAGRVLLNGRELTGPGSERAVVFQQPALYPWSSVRDNIALGLKLQSWPGVNWRAAGRLRPRWQRGQPVDWQRVQYFIDTMGLSSFAKHPPYQLSGGMQQRVAIARALIVEPEVLLMDEPFGALDAQTRNDMQRFLLELWGKINVTAFFITHDVEEAILLADRIVVMSARPGQIVAELPITLPRPRTWDIVLSEDFLALKRQVLEIMRPDLTHAVPLSTLSTAEGSGPSVDARR